MCVPIVGFSEDGLSAIATKLGTHLMLDSYTSIMCIESWGWSSYVRAMIELRAKAELKDSIVVAIPKIEGEGYKVFGHVLDECPKTPVSDASKNIKTKRQAIRGVQIGLKSQLVYRTKKTYTTLRKTKVTDVINDAIFPTTLNSFETLSNMVDVDEERCSRTPSAQEASQVEGNQRKDKQTNVPSSNACNQPPNVKKEVNLKSENMPSTSVMASKKVDEVVFED
ncbi:hypothetical protein Tco_1463865 [Tanacetum coccineum]